MTLFQSSLFHTLVLTIFTFNLWWGL